MLRVQGTYYARTEHGGHRVVADSQGFLVSWPSGSVRYPSARQTLIAITNRTPAPNRHHRDPKLSFDRYFRRGRWALAVPQQDVMTLFSEKISVAAPTVIINGSSDLSIEEPPKGIDLAKRGHEVRKLFYAGYGRRVAKYGYDPEDVLQEIYQGILVRNQGKCPFDPSKSSFGHYVHMICGCIVSNYRRRYSRLERNEQFGVPGIGGAPDSVIFDVREADIAFDEPLQHSSVEMESVHRALSDVVGRRARMLGSDSALARQCLDLMSQGYRKGEIVARTGSRPGHIAKILRMIRQTAAELRPDLGLC